MNQSPNHGTVTVWHRSIASGWMLATGVVAAVGLLVIAGLESAQRTLALWLLIIPAAFLITGAVKVTVSPHGVTAGSVLVPFLRRRFPLQRIQSATARWTRPAEIGGWGYRWNPGLSAISLREGDGLWLSLNGGTQFVITIDDAEAAAALTNQLLEHEGR